MKLSIKSNFCDILWTPACSYLVVNGSSVGAVELVIGSHDVGEVCIPLTA